MLNNAERHERIGFEDFRKNGLLLPAKDNAALRLGLLMPSSASKSKIAKHLTLIIIVEMHSLHKTRIVFRWDFFFIVRKQTMVQDFMLKKSDTKRLFQRHSKLP